MKLPDLRYGWQKLKKDTLAIRGINYSDQLADGDLADSAGLSTRRYPYFSTRHGRPAVDGYTNVTAIYRYSGAGRNNILTVVETGADEVTVAKLYCDGVELHTVIPGEKRQFVTINTKIVVWPDKLMLDMTTEPPIVRDMDASFETVGENVTMTSNSITIPNMPLSAYQAMPYSASQRGTAYTGYWVLTYTNNNLAWDSVQEKYTWTGEPVWKEVCGSNNPSTQLKPGDVLIPVFLSDLTSETTMRAQFVSTNDYRTPPSSHIENIESGRGYMLQVKEMTGFGAIFMPYSRYVDAHVVFNVFDMQNTNASLKTVFREGDALSVSGHPLPVNNKEVIVTTGVTDEKLTFDNDSFVPTDRFGSITDDTMTAINQKTDSEIYLVFASNIYFALYKENGKYCFKKYSSNPPEYIPVNVGQMVYRVGNPAEFYVLKEDETSVRCETTGSLSNVQKVEAPAFKPEDLPPLHLTITRAMPKIDYICEKDNRLWGVVNHQHNRVWDKDAGENGKWKEFESRMIVASSLGMPDDFYDYNGAYSGAYAVAVASEGDFTGIAPYGDAVLCWKERRLCKVLGDYPANYSMHEYTVDGLQAGAHGTQVNISETLLYKGVNGVYAYGGGTPRLISPQFGERRYTAEAAGTDGERYYITLTDSDGNHHLHSYDAQRGIWLRESDDNAVGYVDLPNVFTMLKDDGCLYMMDSGEDDPNLDWYAQFTPMYETMDGKKRYAKLLLRLEIGTNAHVRIMERVDGRPWQQLGRITGKPRNVVTVPVPVARGDKMEFRLEGVGACTILGIQRQFFVGSDV